MIDHNIQTKIDKASALLDEARTYYEHSDYDESERCAREVIALLEAEAERDDLGEELDQTSQKYAIIGLLAHTYNRLNTVSMSRFDYPSAIRHAETAILFCDRIGNLVRKAGLLGNLGKVYSDLLADYSLALDYYGRALVLAEALGNKAYVAHFLGNLGLVHEYLSNYPLALEYLGKALALEEELGNKAGVAIQLGNIGIVYSNLSDYPLALDYYGRALALEEELENKKHVAYILGNIGTVHADILDYPVALDYYGKALALDEELGNKVGVASRLVNIGHIYHNLSDYTNALEYMQKSLAILEGLGNKDGIAICFANIGSTYAKPEFDGYDPAKAEELLLKAVAISEEVGAKASLSKYHEALAELYEYERRWEDFAFHFKKYHNLKDEVLSEEAKKAANLMEQRRQAAERDKLLSIERAEAMATTKILHQVLPSSIADRLIKGEKIADYFSQVSILFADIVGFTPIASKMPARKVLGFLNYVFGEFDRIIEKHGCEKIKTIGDGYMAIAGAPITCEDHAERIARAAIEMMGDIKLPEDIRASLPKGAIFNIRIGINIGPAFGGIVGENRFVYDIYSDAVNTAARMESHGEPDRIHVSEDFAFHLQNRMDMTNDDLGGITFEEREEIEIKGKGMMKTYFLEKKA